MRGPRIHLSTRTVDPCGNIINDILWGAITFPENGAYQTLRHAQQSTRVCTKYMSDTYMQYMCVCRKIFDKIRKIVPRGYLT